MEEKTASENPQKTFTCQLCGLTSPFTYYGQKPPNTRAIVLLEECFVTKDPFSPDRDKFLVLGSICSLCGTCVCVGSPLLHQEVLHAVCEQTLGPVPPSDSGRAGKEEAERQGRGAVMPSKRSAVS
ncbi:cysteine-rich DPF motif domain-containing protein 1 isoform X1 [Archocentrus centrarchus]|uniref:cysteine-rich DPF motif domain-containing protein 1 isoform X1 n=1 Tax=Archocentrus centrarchus TaxID=63155 RepID=UPI0011E9ECD8|nr:cysteine-rich DPF motif domain-containing protein 1 isoform X1 [Archocentrus centrarchus]